MTDCTPRVDCRIDSSMSAREGEEDETPVRFITEYQAKCYLAQWFLNGTEK